MYSLMEPTFQIAYLLLGLVLSIYVMIKGKNKVPFLLLASAGLTIVITDSLTIVPQIFGYSFQRFESLYRLMGVGQDIISITTVAIYAAVYVIYRIIYSNKISPIIDWFVFGLALTRIGLCLIPLDGFSLMQNHYLISTIGNIPVLGLGIAISFVSFKFTSFEDAYEEKLFFESVLCFSSFVLFTNNKIIPLIISALVVIFKISFSSFIGYKYIKKLE